MLFRSGETADGKRLINLVKESQEQTKVWNAGMKGGVSKYTDNASPLPDKSNYSGQQAITNAMRGLTFGGLAGSTAGATLPFQAGTFVGGRLIDSVTGRRSKVRRYIKKNSGKQSFSPIVGLGEKEKTLVKAKAANAKAQAKAEEKRQAERAKRFFLYNEGAPPVDNSPEDIYQQFTGMDRAGLEATIEEALQNPNLDPSVREDLETLIESMKYGERVSGYSVNYINLLANNNPEIGKRRVRPIKDPRGLNTAIAVGTASGRPVTPKEQGKLDNNAIVNQLKKDLEADASLNTSERELVGIALDKMLYDLGINPVDTMIGIEKGLIDSGIPASAVAKYVTAYKDRVIQQQQARKGGDTPPTPTEPTPSPIVGVDGTPLRSTPVVQPEPEPPVEKPSSEPPIVQPDPNPPVTFPKPEGPAVKGQMPKAKKILGAFEIGKKDTRYENGLATREELIEIAEALNITILISDNLTKWKKTNREYGADNKSLGWHRSMTSDRSTIHLPERLFQLLVGDILHLKHCDLFFYF